MEIMQLNHIKVNVETDNWENAIKEAGQLLINDGLIKEGYVKSIINSVNEFGPYMAILPEFILAHSAPSEDVVESSMSIITLKDKVEFVRENIYAKVILCLACKDKNSHLENLQKIAEKLMLDGVVDKIKKSKTSQEIYNLLNL